MYFRWFRQSCTEFWFGIKKTSDSLRKNMYIYIYIYIYIYVYIYLWVWYPCRVQFFTHNNIYRRGKLLRYCIELDCEWYRRGGRDHCVLSFDATGPCFNTRIWICSICIYKFIFTYINIKKNFCVCCCRGPWMFLHWKLGKHKWVYTSISKLWWLFQIASKHIWCVQID